jgi:hypothetical protein
MILVYKMPFQCDIKQFIAITEQSIHGSISFQRAHYYTTSTHTDVARFCDSVSDLDLVHTAGPISREQLWLWKVLSCLGSRYVEMAKLLFCQLVSVISLLLAKYEIGASAWSLLLQASTI